MKIGLALPQYDYSIAGESPLTFATLARHAQAAESYGYDSLWLSDHLFLDIKKYGGTAEPQGAFEPIATLAALAGIVPRVRLGTLVLCEALRPPTMAAKALSTLDRITGGRLDVGLGTGYYEPEYAAIGMELPSPGARVQRLREATEIIIALLNGEDLTYEGKFFSCTGAHLDPPAQQVPRPPVFIGGKGDKMLALIAEVADGWNTCWVWTPEAYQARAKVLDHACESIGRDPLSVERTLGLYALVGENEADLAARFARLQQATPAGVLDSMSLDEWRKGRLVGTAEQVREQAQVWSDLGVTTIIVGAGALPFQIGALADVAVLAEVLGSGSDATSTATSG